MVLTYCLATATSYLVDITIFNSLFMKCFMKKKPDFEITQITVMEEVIESMCIVVWLIYFVSYEPFLLF